ncbi:MAG TPA: IS5 family transposase [Anaerolineae bacterium]|nr:IS5 family transposase [Anaerolineae bacterium]
MRQFDSTQWTKSSLGRSRGGFTSKLHILTDALGNPLRFRLTAGQSHDVTQAPEWLEDWQRDFVIGDTSYDAAALVEQIESQGALAVIPSHRRRKQPRWVDRALYRERHVVECFVNKLKYYRHLFSRFDKLATHYLGFVHFVATLIWLR